MSESVWPRRQQPTRLCHPWDSPGKKTGVGCHLLLQCMKVKSEKWKWSRSVVSDSSWLHGMQPTRLLHPWDFPGKSTGVECHHLLWEVYPNNMLNKDCSLCLANVNRKEGIHLTLTELTSYGGWIYVQMRWFLLSNACWTFEYSVN